MAHSTSLFAALSSLSSSPAPALRFHHRPGSITAGRPSSLKVFFPSAGDLRPELDENPEAIISGEWAPNFSLLSYDDLLDYIRSQPPAKKHVGSKTLLREVMSKTVRAARADQSVGEIAYHFEFVSGLPVVDDERRCLGVVCKTDLAKANHEMTSTTKNQGNRTGATDLTLREKASTSDSKIYCMSFVVEGAMVRSDESVNDVE